MKMMKVTNAHLETYSAGGTIHDASKEVVDFIKESNAEKITFEFNGFIIEATYRDTVSGLVTKYINLADKHYLVRRNK